jgi:cytochrome c-type biogenesis protein CcmF
MSASVGNFSLWLSLCFAIFQFLISRKKNNRSVLKFNKIAVNGLLLCVLVSFFSLMYSHVISDFSVVNVFQNSHTTKPLLYKISGVWGNHEGSMLLWILVLTIFNYFIYKLYNQKNFTFISKSLEIQAIITIGFLLFTIFTSNPFERMIPAQVNGLGFNPLLQDPALAIHPPLLYIGYVGFSAAFSFSIAAMSINTEEKISWYSYIKPFVLTAWTFLSAGIAFGSIWAYYELGWGGWWFWDPVENASFMPWLLGTALVHSLIAVEKKKSLQSWVLLLSILAFLLSVIGTFLVRSGILTSVHTFALDPARGIYILVFITLLGGYSLILFGIKSKNFLNKHYFSFFSREGSILVNNVLMITVCASVFLGTIYPLLVEAFSNNKISVGEPYFNSTTIPIMIPAILVMGIGPILSWNRGDATKIFGKSFPSILLTTVISIIFFCVYRPYNMLGLVGIILAFWIISNILLTLVPQLILKNKKFIQDNIPKYSNGMIIAHLGIGLLILGITGSSIWQKEKITRMKVNDKTEIHNYNIIFKEINKITGQNYLALQGNFWVYNKKKNIIAELKPENRFYPVANNSTTEVSIHTNLLRDLYIVLGEGDINEGWVVRIYYNPLVIWIWIGAFMIFLGGLFSIKSNLKFIKRLTL